MYKDILEKIKDCELKEAEINKKKSEINNDLDQLD